MSIHFKAIPKFASDYPEIAQTLEQARLTFYCMNCYRKRSTAFLTPDFGPLCHECIEELDTKRNEY